MQPLQPDVRHLIFISVNYWVLHPRPNLHLPRQIRPSFPRDPNIHLHLLVLSALLFLISFMDPPRLPCVNPFGLQDSPIKRSDSVASFKITSTQPNVQLQDASFTPIPKINMDRPVKYESPKDGRPSPKRPRPSSFDITLDSSPVFSHAQSSPINSSPTKSSPVIPIKQERCQSPSSVRKPGQYIQLTPVQ